VGSRHFQNKAHRSFWSVHVQAWRQSCLTRTECCREQRLTKGTFDRWLKALDAWDSLRIEERERRRRAKHPVSSNKRNKAVQAFWAIHVEALNWSRTTAKDYAAAHHLSVYTLRTWRARLEAEPQLVDWRARLHPSALAQISTGASSAAKEPSVENSLTDTSNAAPARDGRSNRRSFTDAEKLAIVMEAEQPGVSAAAVCRRHNIATSMIFRWRIQFGLREQEQAKFAAVRIANGQLGDKPTTADVALDLQNVLPKPDGMAVVELADGRKVFAPIGVDPDAVRKHVEEQEKTQ
jgi:transposase-like protein